MLPAFAASVLSGLFWLWYFNRYDQQREPWPLLGKCVLWGALAVLPALIWEAPFRGLLQSPRVLTTQILLSFLVVGLGEEAFKLLAAYLAAGLSPEFNQPIDGIIYAIAAAVGFSIVENILYIRAFGPLAAPFRGSIASLAHIAFSGLAGYYLGKARFSSSKLDLLKGVGTAAFLHGLYDFLLIAHLASPLIIAVFMIAIHYFLLNAIHKAKKASLLR